LRIIRTIFLFLAISVILAHSVFPHHHHTEEKQAIQNEEDHHDHKGSKWHQHDDSEDHHHGIFTSSQIENIFLTGKQLVVSMVVTSVIAIFEWSSVIYKNQEPDNFYIKDIELPPLIRCQKISFRGPPLI
jgi:hypothetical protein